MPVLMLMPRCRWQYFQMAIFYRTSPNDSEKHNHLEYNSVLLILKIATIIASEAVVQKCCV